MDLSYAVVADIQGDTLPDDQQAAVMNLLRRDEVAQVVWAKRVEPQLRPVRHRQVLVAMVLLNHTATDREADEVSQILSGLGAVVEVRVERPGSPHDPDAAVRVAPPTASRPPRPAG